jgi:hypothetical protein
MRYHWMYLFTLAALAVAAPGASAQEQQAPQAPQGQEQLSMEYEREVFVYRPAGRRDPFMPLTSESVGPRFEDLALGGIIYSPTPGRSVAVLRAGSRLFRVRVGDQVGNVRVLEIGPRRVVFAVNDFGQVRQEVLELKREEGAGG